jgi:hypothetical protein
MKRLIYMLSVSALLTGCNESKKYNYSNQSEIEKKLSSFQNICTITK